MALIALAGCDQDHPLRPPPCPFGCGEVDQSTPQRTLWSLKFAWEQRDSLRIREIYAEEYQGISYSPDTTLMFSQDMEVSTVSAIGRDPDVRSVSMDLPLQNTWVSYASPQDPPGWIGIDVDSGMVVQLVTTDRTYVARASSHTFKFRPYVTGADTTWRIVQWYENPRGTAAPALP